MQNFWRQGTTKKTLASRHVFITIVVQSKGCSNLLHGAVASADLFDELIIFFSHLYFIESIESYNNLILTVIWKNMVILLNTSKEPSNSGSIAKC